MFINGRTSIYLVILVIAPFESLTDIMIKINYYVFPDCDIGWGSYVVRVFDAEKS